MATQHADRFLNRHGQSITLTSFSAGATDSYNDPTWTALSNTVQARVQLMSKTGRIIVDAAGEERAADLTVWIKDSWSVPVDADRAPEVTASGVTYKVEIVDDVQDNGLVRLDCVRVR